ncbi:hypothetical protein KUCAC02_031346 [Chaenocephalus aceratus]|nr:hypothetical protein KUCAC02_031346 [Chaenocephalus aceratus]
MTQSGSGCLRLLSRVCSKNKRQMDKCVFIDAAHVKKRRPVTGELDDTLRPPLCLDSAGCDEPPVIPVTQDHRAAPHRAATRTLENCEKRKNVKLELLRPRSSASSDADSYVKLRNRCRRKPPGPVFLGGTARRG